MLIPTIPVHFKMFVFLSNASVLQNRAQIVLGCRQENGKLSLMPDSSFWSKVKSANAMQLGACSSAKLLLPHAEPGSGLEFRLRGENRSPIRLQLAIDVGF